jgi:hypothetical protein
MVLSILSDSEPHGLAAKTSTGTAAPPMRQGASGDVASSSRDGFRWRSPSPASNAILRAPQDRRQRWISLILATA